MDSTLKILSVFTSSQFHDFLIDLQMSSTPLLLSIDEIEGNTTAISQHIPSTGVGGPRTTLREKVYCVLGANNYLHTPVHTQSFNPRHISALTLQLRSLPLTRFTARWTSTTRSWRTPPTLGCLS